MRLYSIVFDAVAITAAQDLFSITPADDRQVRIHALYLSQTTELGDAAEEMLRVNIIRGHATVGSGGTAPTPQPLDPHDAAAGFAARVNDTTIASTGTPVTLHADAFNVRSGMVYLPTPETQIQASQGQGLLVVRLMAAPADSIAMGGTLVLAEL